MAQSIDRRQQYRDEVARSRVVATVCEWPRL